MTAMRDEAAVETFQLEIAAHAMSRAASLSSADLIADRHRTTSSAKTALNANQSVAVCVVAFHAVAGAALGFVDVGQRHHLG